MFSPEYLVEKEFAEKVVTINTRFLGNHKPVKAALTTHICKNTYLVDNELDALLLTEHYAATSTVRTNSVNNCYISVIVHKKKFDKN